MAMYRNKMSANDQKGDRNNTELGTLNVHRISTNLNLTDTKKVFQMLKIAIRQISDFLKKCYLTLLFCFHESASSSTFLSSKYKRLDWMSLFHLIPNSLEMVLFIWSQSFKAYNFYFVILQ